MFSLIDHITTSPRIVVCGFPSSGKSTFVSHVLSKHVGDQKQDETTSLGYTFVNYKGRYSFYLKEENDLTVATNMSSSDFTENYRQTYFILFVNASIVNQNETISSSLKSWLQEVLLEDRKYLRIKDLRSNSVFIAVSHLDNPDAVSIDEIDEKLNSHSFRKLLCSYGFPNFETQVDTFIQEVGDSIGAKTNTLKDAWRNTEKVRTKLAESALSTTSWIAHQSSELASTIVQQSSELANTISEQLSNDHSSLASLAIIGLNSNDRDAVFNLITGKFVTTNANEITVQQVKDFVGFTFKLCNVSPLVTVSKETRQLVETSNGLIFVVSESVPLEEQKAYFNECLVNVDKSVPVLYVSVGFELNNEEWMKLSEGKFVCAIEYIQGLIPAVCNFITEHQKIKTSNSVSILSNIVPQFEDTLNSSIDWTIQHQQVITNQLQEAVGAVKESVKDYTPQIQETLHNVSESVSENFKNVSNVVSGYWNSFWSNE